MQVFILEDDPYHKLRLKGLIHEVGARAGLLLNQIQTFSKPQILMHYVTESLDPQVYFLEVNLNGDIHYGYEAAAKIRQKNPRAIIILVASDLSYSELSFNYHIAALDYLDKTSEDSQIKNEIQDILELIETYSSRYPTSQIA